MDVKYQLYSDIQLKDEVSVLFGHSVLLIVRHLLTMSKCDLSALFWYQFPLDSQYICVINYPNVIYMFWSTVNVILAMF